MTKSTITRERLEWLSQISCRDDIEDIGGDEIRELASIALAAMDSEPVYQYQSGVYNDDNGETDWYWDDCDKGFYEQYAHDRRRILYRHAQPVVPDEMLCDFYEVNNWTDLVRELVKHVEQLQDSARRNVKPWEDTFPETLLPAYIERIKHADEACRAAMLQAGNSPVIPDGSEWTNEQCLEFLTVAFRHNEISGDIEFDDIRLGVKFALSAAPQEVNHG